MSNKKYLYAMNTDLENLDPSIWRPQARFDAVLNARNQLRDFNSTGGVAVFIDVMGAVTPHIEIRGTQSRFISFWETQSQSGFITKPKFSAGLITVRFVASGQISYLRRDGEIVASTALAALTGFDDLREVRAVGPVSAVSATISIDSLVAANELLVEDNPNGFPPLEPIADMKIPGMWALFCTVRQILSRLKHAESCDDLILPLLQEIMSYQLLSSWPKRSVHNVRATTEASSRHMRLAIDYIETNLANVMTLEDVSSAARVGVRSLQLKFKKELGMTPVEFIIGRRLARAHEDLLSAKATGRSVAQIARSWGFVHMSDFGQRYRRLYGCTPSQTRSNIDHDRRDD